MRHRFHVLAAAILIALAATEASASAPPSRYAHHGDGLLILNSGRGAFNGRFRTSDGAYDAAAMRRINRVFGAAYGNPATEISPRFIEFLDFLQDHYNPRAAITIASGYRSPSYNTHLRERGKLAAKASLHQYGMAADLSIQGVPADAVWNFIKELNFGGAGYYHGKLTHVDVGPARSWDETTSGVGTDISDDNKLIVLVADKDLYLPGEATSLRFIRMTAFPIGVAPLFALERDEGEKGWKRIAELAPPVPAAASGACPQFQDIAAMADLRVVLPADLAQGNYRVRAAFCDRAWEAMPPEVATAPFEVLPR